MPRSSASTAASGSSPNRPRLVLARGGRARFEPSEVAMAEAVLVTVDDLDGRADVRVLILTGAGGTFCAGMDLKGFLAGDMPTVPGRGFAGITERPPAKPIIAAVEGYA